MILTIFQSLERVKFGQGMIALNDFASHTREHRTESKSQVWSVPQLIAIAIDLKIAHPGTAKMQFQEGNMFF